MKCSCCKRSVTGKFGIMHRGFVCLILVLCALPFSCHQTDYMPKPRGYHRIEFPEHTYIPVANTGCPYTFEKPLYSEWMDDRSRDAQPCWKNLDFPQFNARLHVSYYKLNKEVVLSQLTEDARKFAFTHTTKATSIDQQYIDLPEANIYGLEYSIKGNTASNYQFYITDSAKHYLRAALYFNEKPNLDSIQPVLDFLTTDIRHLIGTLRWQ